MSQPTMEETLRDLVEVVGIDNLPEPEVVVWRSGHRLLVQVTDADALRRWSKAMTQTHRYCESIGVQRFVGVRGVLNSRPTWTAVDVYHTERAVDRTAVAS